MKLETKLLDTNYRAKIVKLDNFSDHPNADRLKITKVDYQDITVGLDTKEGELYVYFPIECAINKSLLGHNNLFRKSEFGNIDETKSGYFEKHGRVRAIKFRSVVSEGFLMNIDQFNSWIQSKDINLTVGENHVGQEFDHIGGNTICKKYIPIKLYRPFVVREKITVGKLLENYKMNIDEFNSLNDTSFTLKCKLSIGDEYYVPKNSLKSGQKSEKSDRLVQDQLRLHVDTENLKRNLDKINPDDIITISEKYHGTSFTLQNILIKRELSIKDRIARFFGVKIWETEYALVPTSRRVIKDDYISGGKSDNFYDFDIWGQSRIDIGDKIQEGYCVYGEVVGYLPTGASIQGGYDYGCGEGEYKYLVYRMTYTTPQGEVIELTHPQVQRYCEKYGLEMPETHYHGRASNYVYTPELDYTKDWHDSFLNKLQKEFNEMDCPNCRNEVPREGIILRKESDTFEAYKLKSLRFLEKESDKLDKGEVNIEEES